VAATAFLEFLDFLMLLLLVRECLHSDPFDGPFVLKAALADLVMASVLLLADHSSGLVSEPTVLALALLVPQLPLAEDLLLLVLHPSELFLRLLVLLTRLVSDLLGALLEVLGDGMSEL